MSIQLWVHRLVLGCVLLGSCFWRVPVSLAHPCLPSMHPPPHPSWSRGFWSKLQPSWFSQKRQDQQSQVSESMSQNKPFPLYPVGYWSKWQKSNDSDISHSLVWPTRGRGFTIVATKMAGEEAGLRGGSHAVDDTEFSNSENTRRKVSGRGET